MEDRYSWIGNFGENRPVVRDFENNYFHIDGNGDRYIEKIIDILEILSMESPLL